MKGKRPLGVLAALVMGGATFALVPAPQATAATSVYLAAHGTSKSGGRIHSSGEMSVSSSKPISIKVYGQRKVCGAFGCNWHNKAERGVGKSWAKRTGTVRVSQGCAGGTHRYRTLAHGFVRQPWGTVTYSKIGANREYRC